MEVKKADNYVNNRVKMKKERKIVAHARDTNFPFKFLQKTPYYLLNVLEQNVNVNSS